MDFFKLMYRWWRTRSVPTNLTREERLRAKMFTLGAGCPRGGSDKMEFEIKKIRRTDD